MSTAALALHEPRPDAAGALDVTAGPRDVAVLADRDARDALALDVGLVAEPHALHVLPFCGFPDPPPDPSSDPRSAPPARCPFHGGAPLHPGDQGPECALCERAHEARGCRCGGTGKAPEVLAGQPLPQGALLPLRGVLVPLILVVAPPHPYLRALSGGVWLGGARPGKPMNVEQLTVHRARIRFVYEAAVMIRRRLDQAAVDFENWTDIDGDAEVWAILQRWEEWRVTVASLETARAEAHATAKAEVDEGYDFGEDDGEPSPGEPAAEPALASADAPAAGPLTRIASMLAAAAVADVPDAGGADDDGYGVELEAARAKVDALYDTARDILRYLASLPPEHPFHSDPEDICGLVDDNASAEDIETEQRDKLACIDAALTLRVSFEASVAGIVADAQRQRAEVRSRTGERAPSKAAEKVADDLKASSAEEAILELFTEGP